MLYVKLPRSTVVLEIKSDYDTALIDECVSHGDILECFVCHFVSDPVLLPPSLVYGESEVGEGASQSTRPNASFDGELEPTMPLHMPIYIHLLLSTLSQLQILLLMLIKL